MDVWNYCHLVIEDWFSIDGLNVFGQEACVWMSWCAHLEVPLMVLVSSQQIGIASVDGRLESSTSRLHLKYTILDTQLYVSELVILQANCILIASSLLRGLWCNRALRCRTQSLIPILVRSISATRLSLYFLLTLVFWTILLLDFVFSHLWSQLLDSLVYFPLIFVLKHFHSGLALLGSWWYRFGGFTWLLLCLERSEILKELTEVHIYKKNFDKI